MLEIQDGYWRQHAIFNHLCGLCFSCKRMAGEQGMTAASRLGPFLTSAGVFALDRVTKNIIRNQVTPWDNYTVIPRFFSIVHSENQGAAFGLFAESSSQWRTFLLVLLALGVMLFITALL